VADFDWENRADASAEDIKVLQQALQDLGHPVNVIDGVITPGGATEREYNVFKNALTEAETNNIFTPEHALAALAAIKTDRNAVKAIQSALIEAEADLGSYGADGDAGALTRAAVEAHPEVALNAIAAYIDKTDNKNVEARLISEKPADGDAIDAALTKWMEGGQSDTSMEEFISKYTGDVDSHARNANAQYIALWLQANGHEDNILAGQIMEAVMAE